MITLRFGVRGNRRGCSEVLVTVMWSVMFFFESGDDVVVRVVVAVLCSYIAFLLIICFDKARRVAAVLTRTKSHTYSWEVQSAF